MTTTEPAPTTTDHTPTVLAIYQAFGQGDIPTILSHLSEDISWDQGLRETTVPWMQPGHGVPAVLAFFEALGAGLEFSVFEPISVSSSGQHVVGVVREVAVARATGRQIDEDLFVHLWTFGADGKVSAFRHIGDLHRHQLALS
jgi:ketosteroid isomerase-like protein